MKLSRNETIFLSACILNIIVFALLFYFDLTSRADAGEGRVVGMLTYKLNNAQRKYEKQVVWEDLEAPSATVTIPLYNRDAIRTAAASEAVITLRDKTKIQLDPDSMIILSVSEEALNINYAYGSVQARRSGPGEGIVKIQTKDNRTITIADSDVKISAAEGKAVNVTVSRGEATVRSGETEKKVIRDQVAVLSAGTIEVKPLTIRPLAPPDNNRFFTTTGQAEIRFQWATDRGIEPALELSSDRDFRRGVRRLRTVDDGLSLTVKPGIHYWRLGAHNPDNSRLEYGPIRSLTVLENRPIRLIAPATGEQFEFIDREPRIHFSWTKNDFASEYLIELGTDRKLSGARTVRSGTTGISIPLSEGKYFFRIRSVSDFRNAAVTSPIGNFIVARRSMLSPPRLRQPETGRRISSVVAEKVGISFAWVREEAIRNYELSIISPRRGSKPQVHRATDSFFLLRQKMETGDYRWKVRGLDDENRPRTPYSAERMFRITGKISLGLIAPPDNASFTLIRSQGTGIEFNWRQPVSGGRYRLALSRSRDMKTDRLERTVNQPRASLWRLKAGRYYWRVNLLSGSGVELAESAIRMLEITDRLADPVILFPLSGSVVDMTRRNALTIRWKEVRGAEHYRVRLYRRQKEERKMVSEGESPVAEYAISDLARLDRGRYELEVQAVHRLEGQQMVSRIIKSAFRITMSKLEKPDIITPRVDYTY